jgi:hypothetical protein
MMKALSTERSSIDCWNAGNCTANSQTMPPAKSMGMLIFLPA